MKDPRLAKFLFCLSAAIILMIVLSGCQEGSGDIPLPRLICTQVTDRYSCGRGGICERCGNWEVGCPKPLKLTQIPTGSYDQGEPRLACRLKEGDHGIDESAAPEVASPLR